MLVGVTEAVEQNKVIISKKGVKSTGNLKASQYHDLATALGNGFDIIDYETHCKIAHLFYAKYANRNPQEMSQFGDGEDSYTRIIGTTSSLGNNEGKTSTQISFLGMNGWVEYILMVLFTIFTMDLNQVQFLPLVIVQ